jgi:hypothetical protein
MGESNSDRLPRSPDDQGRLRTDTDTTRYQRHDHDAVTGVWVRRSSSASQMVLRQSYAHALSCVGQDDGDLRRIYASLKTGDVDGVVEFTAGEAPSSDRNIRPS